MRMSHLGLAGLLCLSSVRLNAQSPSPDATALAITHVTVIPMDSVRELPDQTVIVRAGRIEQIGPAASIVPPVGAGVSFRLVS